MNRNGCRLRADRKNSLSGASKSAAEPQNAPSSDEVNSAGGEHRELGALKTD